MKESDVLYLIALTEIAGSDAAISEAIELGAVDMDSHIYSDVYKQSFQDADDFWNGYT